MSLFLTLNRLLSQPNAATKRLDEIILICENIISENRPPDDQSPDEIRPILVTIQKDSPFDSQLTKVLKILLRKESNRASLGRSGVSSIVAALTRQSRDLSAVSNEICNVILNTCYDGENVREFIEVNGMPPLFSLLRSRDPLVLAGALGAIQGLCFVVLGREVVRQNPEIFQLIIQLLCSEHPSVRARAIGTIHNLSIDIVSIEPLREGLALPIIVQLLSDSDPEIIQNAAGALQNLSRESRCRQLLHDQQAIPPLVDLVFGNNVTCQVSAVGAILNILGPVLTEEERLSLRETLSEGIALGALRSSIFPS